MFSDFAPKYWAAGLPVMPLRPAAKIPALPSWQMLCAEMPSTEQQTAWLGAYGNGNMGLPLGPCAGIIALDLDSEDPRVQAVLDKIMPPSPWKRIGKKGAVYAFKYNGERTYRIKAEDGSTILEILSRGAQIVMPPSIHPDTQLPYVSNTELLDVLDQLVCLPPDFEAKVRQALIDAGLKLSSRGATKVTEWVPSGGRDSALTAMAGLLARGVIRKERTLLEAINEAEAWVANYTEKVVGDELDPKKASKKVLEFLRRDITEGKKQLPSGWDAGMTPDEIREMKEYFGEEFEEWEVSQILDYIQDKFTQIPRENVPARQEVIEDVLARIVRSEQLTTLDEETIFNFLVSGSSRQVTLSALRKRVKEMTQGEIVGQDHTEIAQALMADMEREGEIRFHHSNFHQWFGSHWKLLEETEVMRRLSLDYGELPAAKRFSDHKGILGVCQKLKAAELNTWPIVGINFANGYLTDDMQLLNHDPRYGATYVLPYRYMPDDRAPAMFMSFLDQCWGQDEDYLEKVQALREAIAVTLFGQATRFQRAICLYGVAGSGKTRLLEIVRGLLPSDTISNVSPDEWSDKFLPTQMNGKLLNMCGELSESSMIPSAYFKQIVEGAEMNGQFKGKDIFKFRPLCAQWFASNHLPRSRDSSAGFNRRWLILQFRHAVPPEVKRINIVEEILSEEREAIVAWAVPAIQDLIRRSDYTQPKSHAEQVSEIAAQNNSVRFFLTNSEMVILTHSEDDVLLEKDLYHPYFSWAKMVANVSPVQLKRFRLMLQDLQQDLGFSMIIEKVPGGERASFRGMKLIKGR